MFNHSLPQGRLSATEVEVGPFLEPGRDAVNRLSAPHRVVAVDLGSLLRFMPRLILRSAHDPVADVERIESGLQSASAGRAEQPSAQKRCAL